MQIKDCLIQELCKSKFVNNYYDLTGCESVRGMSVRVVVLLSLELQELSSLLPLWLLNILVRHFRKQTTTREQSIFNRQTCSDRQTARRPIQ